MKCSEKNSGFATASSPKYERKGIANAVATITPSTIVMIVAQEFSNHSPNAWLKRPKACLCFKEKREIPLLLFFTCCCSAIVFFLAVWAGMLMLLIYQNVSLKVTERLLPGC